MGTRHTQGLLFLFLGATLTVVQNLQCHKGISVSIEEDPSNTFNWTTEKVETCDNGALCQESILIIKSGTKTALLASKGCISKENQAITFVQHSPPPGVMAISYSSYCERPLCNHREELPETWIPNVIPASNMSATLHCPTCLALGTCFSAPSLPCPNDTTRCYQGRLRVNGGDMDSTLEVKGCTSVTGCRLMSGVFAVGPMWVKEMCTYQSLAQPRKLENGATWLPISLGKLEPLLLLFLSSLVHCS